MNNNLTTKLMEALHTAQKNAASGGRAQIYPSELLLSLVQQEGGVLASVLSTGVVVTAPTAHTFTHKQDTSARDTKIIAIFFIFPFPIFIDFICFLC
jgi:hypothetical protein